MTNYNEAGVNYVSYGQSVAHSIGGYMPEQAVLAKFTLVAALHRDAAHQGNHDWIRNYLGVLHHLDSVLLAVETIVDHLDYLRNNLLSPEPCLLFPKTTIKREGHKESFHNPPALIGISTKYLEIEIETLLLKSAGAMERIAQLVDSKCGLGGVWVFKKLAAKLQTRQNDPVCKTLLELITEVTPALAKTVIADVGANECLRNAIAHRASSPELMEKGITINWLEDGALLPFDAEIEGTPLIATVHNLSKVIPYFVLKCVQTLLRFSPHQSNARDWAISQNFDQSNFEPTWKNPFLHFSALIDPSNTGPIVSLFRWAPGGFLPHQRHLVPAVLGMAVTPTKVPLAS